MRLVIDVDKQYKKLFMEAAKAAKAKLQIDEHYLTEAEEDKALLKLMEEGKKEGRMSEKEHENFNNRLFSR
ncbi:hypothetical protein GO730_32925 [Spirosoma sp. HMF3257]|uniref:Uncharacterized protein n=1 Tax=Spirosoma telluris TaxID=2183553 RepID=A0A327NQL4_9BACT|nr:hypothetical protein [Spirosoma telluris]RAI77731.1 hypothetical protein HMF3257_32830 [Spirosoma telluris]